MRYLRLSAVILLVFSLVFAGWANNRYHKNQNSDYPEIINAMPLLEISVDDPPEAIFQGLTARDATDGDLTEQIMVASMSHFYEPGTVHVKYVVFDSHNNSATLTRQVHYTDYKTPKFELEKSPVYTTGNSCDLLDHIRVIDGIDGDISDHVRVISNLVNNYTAGSYPMVLEVSNSCGDTVQIVVWVTYESKVSTAVVSLHQYIVYVEQGQTFEPRALIASVTDRTATPLDPSLIEVQGNLDVNNLGCYQLTYSYDDGTLFGYAPLTVVVTEKEG